MKKIELKKPYWQMQDGETNLAFERFQVYRDSPTTLKLREVAERVNMDPSKANINSLNTQSHKYRWDERRRAYLEHLDSLKLKEAEERITKMHIRHAGHAELAEKVLMMPVRVLGQRLNTPEIDVLNEMQLKDLIKLVNENLKLYPNLANQERIARGEPTDISKSDNKTDITSGGEVIKVLLPEGR